MREKDRCIIAIHNVHAIHDSPYFGVGPMDDRAHICGNYKLALLNPQWVTPREG
jgi:hypothetical protein